MQRTPRLFEFYVLGEVVRLDELAESLCLEGNSLRKHVSSLIQGGHLQPIRPGLYAVGSTTRLSPYVLGSHIVPSARLAMGTALAFYAGRALRHGESVYVLSRQPFRRFCFRGIDYHCCLPWHDDLAARAGLGPSQLYDEQRHPKWGPSPVRLCSPALAIVECLGRPVHCRTLTEFLELCARLPSAPDVSVMLNLARALKRRALSARLGLLLDLFRESWRVDPELLKELFELRPKRPAPWVVEESQKPFDQWTPLQAGLVNWRIDLRHSSN